MTQRELMGRMQYEEFFEWWTYFNLEDDKFKEKIDKQIKLERSSTKTDQQRADDMVEMFMGLQNGINSRSSN